MTSENHKVTILEDLCLGDKIAFSTGFNRIEHKVFLARGALEPMNWKPPTYVAASALIWIYAPEDDSVLVRRYTSPGTKFKVLIPNTNET